jgi:hypothetical protein
LIAYEEFNISRAGLSIFFASSYLIQADYKMAHWLFLLPGYEREGN